MELNLKLQRLFGFALAKNIHPHGMIHSFVRSFKTKNDWFGTFE